MKLKIDCVANTKTNGIAIAVSLLLLFTEGAYAASQLTGLSGAASGSVALSPGDRLVATASPGLQVSIATTTSNALVGTATTWSAVSCAGCAWARNLAFDDTDRLWVAASGYGLWRGAVNGTFSAVTLGDSNLAHWVARAADGSMWVVTGNSVLEVQAGDKTRVRGSNSATLALRQLALANTAAGTAYAASGAEVFQLGEDDRWVALKAPRTPVTIAHINNVLHLGSTDGVWRFDKGTWTELGPKGVHINDLVAAADGSVIAATERQGLMQYSGSKWSTVGDNLSFADKRVKALASDSRGTVYAATASGVQMPLALAADRATARASQREINAALNAGLALGALQQVVSTRNDVYALLEGQGIFSRVGKSARWEPANDGLDDEPVRLVGTSDAAYTLTASGSIFSFTAPTSSAGSWVKLASITAAVSEIGVAPDGTLWAALRDGPPLQRDGRSGKWSTADKGLIGSGRTTVFAFTSTGVPLLGTSRGGVFRWEVAKGAWSSVGLSGLPMQQGRHGMGRSAVTALYADGGKLYAGTEHGIFAIADTATSDATWTSVGRGLADPHVTSVTTDTKGNLIAGTINGAFLLAGASSEGVWSPYSGTNGEVIASVAKVGNEVVVATKRQVGKPARTMVGD